MKSGATVLNKTSNPKPSGKRRSSAIFQSRNLRLDTLATSFGGLSLDQLGLFPQQEKTRKLRSFSKIAEELHIEKTPAQRRTSNNANPISSLFSVQSYGFTGGMAVIREPEQEKNSALKQERTLALEELADFEDVDVDLNIEYGLEMPQGMMLTESQASSPRTKSVEEKISTSKLFASPEMNFTPSILPFDFSSSLKLESTPQAANVSNTNPFGTGSGVVESSDLYNLDLDEYYSATSPPHRDINMERTTYVKTEENLGSTLKRTKDKARFDNFTTMSRVRAGQKMNAARNVSMAPSLDNAPLLKLRRRTIQRNVENTSGLRLRSSTTRVLSEQIAARRSIFDNPYETGKTYISSKPNGGWVGAYSPKRRKALIKKFLDKRNRRVWNKKIRYAVRKNFADSRLRVKGRFVGKEDEATLRDCLLLML